MASPPSRTDLSGAPTTAAYKLAIGGLYDYVASLLGNGTATIASETEKKLARESLGVGSFGFKNRFINPSFLISQEFGTSSTSVTAGGAIKYVVDQWYASCAGANITSQLIAGISNQKYSLRLTGSSGNTAVTFGQRMEGINCVDFKSQMVTVSINLKASTAKTISWGVFYANTEDNFSSKTSIASGTIDVITSIENYSFTFNAGASAGNGLAVEFLVGALGVSETFDFDCAQIEKSNVKTEYETRDFGTEAIKCFRYFERLNEVAGIRSSFGTGVVAEAYWHFKAQKRVTPTIVSVGGLGVVATISAGHTSRYTTDGSRAEIGVGTSANARL